MDFRALRYFCSVGELRSFTGAARALRIAQPAISRQIRKLEDEVGLELLVRGGAGIELTEAGRMLFDRAQFLLQQLDQLRHDLDARFKVPAESFTMAAPPTAGALLMPSVLRTARTLLPGLSITVSEQVGQVVIEQLLARQLSLGLLFDPAPHGGLHTEPLVIERLHLFGCSGSRCSDPAPVTVQDLVGLPLVLPPHPHNVRVLIEDAAAEAGVTLVVAYEIVSLAVIRQVVSQDNIYGILTAGSVHASAEPTNFVSKPIDAPGLSMTLTMILRNEMRQSSLARQIMSLIRVKTAQLVQDGRWPGQPRYVPN